MLKRPNMCYIYIYMYMYIYIYKLTERIVVLLNAIFNLYILARKPNVGLPVFQRSGNDLMMIQLQG